LKKLIVNKIYNKDCIIGMKAIPDEKIDLVVLILLSPLISRLKKQTIIELPQEFCLATTKSKLKIIMISQMLGCTKYIEF